MLAGTVVSVAGDVLKPFTVNQTPRESSQVAMGRAATSDGPETWSTAPLWHRVTTATDDTA